MNVVEAYIKFKGHLVIFLSGMSGCGKTSIAKKLAQQFKITFLDQFSYYKTDYNKKITLPDGTEIINWHTDDAIDWDKLNKDISNNSKKGVIVSGFAFPIDKIKIDPDIHVHLSISKKICMEKRRKFLEKNKDKFSDEQKIIGTNTEKLKMNQIIFPYYLDTLKRMKVHKFINIHDLDNKQIYSEKFDYLIERIENFLYEELPKIKNRPANENSFENSTSDEVDQELPKIKNRPTTTNENPTEDEDEDDEEDEEIQILTEPEIEETSSTINEQDILSEE
jgi:cytidylate kinase